MVASIKDFRRRLLDMTALASVTLVVAGAAHGQAAPPAAADTRAGADLASAPTAPPDIGTPMQTQTQPADGPSTPSAGSDADATIVVTGSRIGSLANNSPTPLTVVSKEQLTATTPSNIPDALNKLPVFQGSQQARAAGNGSRNQASNVLNLRNFGAQRTLVLLDGHRVTPSNSDGTVDADSLPQLLVQRVDVVTGGASAVYGSDAVTGVVNFILDKKFTGIKLDLNSGISTYGDAFRFKTGIAAGTELFGGRGHIVASYEHRASDPLANFDRPYGRSVYVLTGAGSAANPFVVSANVRRGDSSFGGKITYCGTGCTVNNYQFSANGVLTPFATGTLTGTANQNVGGDGAYSIYSTAIVRQRNDEGFVRASFDLASDVEVYVQGIYANAFSSGWAFPAKLTPGTGATVSQAGYFFKNNPFLSPAVQAALGNNGRSDGSNLFSLGTYIVNTGESGTTGTRNNNRNIEGMIGFDGKLGRFKWDLFYKHGENRLQVDNLNNSNYQKQFAALDAVNVNGQIQCYAATQAATAAAYAGCVPLNAFGPTAITQQAFAWFTQTTTFVQTNTLDDVGGSIAGKVFEGWAGPINAALSAEYRRSGYKVTSNASPTALVDCTGLRICSPTLQLWAQPVSAAVDVSNHVAEVAGEVGVPILRDLPFVQSFDVNLAGRYTDYSTSGSVKTWKVGADWKVSDDLRFRGTTSLDIRAPTLNDLYQPLQAAVSGFVDIHTATSNTLYNISRGNPNLQPEKARTWTGGFVLTPRFLPGFSFSVDYYRIKMNNAIGVINPSNTTIQQICEASGGTSPYCALFIRPLPFDNRTSANFPTQVIQQSLNVALQKIRGFDFETNYRFRALGGTFTLRALANYQPTNVSQPFAGAPLISVAAAKTRATGFARFDIGDWGFALQDQWLSSFKLATQSTQYYAKPRFSAFNTLDLNIERKLKLFHKDVSAYLTVQNLFNARSDLLPSAGSIGLLYPVPAGYDIIGRFFTLGVRTKF